MMRVFVFLLAMMVSIRSQAVEIVSTTLVKSYTVQELKDYFKTKKLPKFLVKVSNGVDIYKVMYKTPNYDGKMLTASGVVVVPKDGKGPYPMVSYQHGTQIKKDEAPSLMRGEFLVGLGLAADGYAVSMPDYIGLGSGEGTHLYIHSETEASASIDMLRAANEVAKQNNVSLNGQLFLIGYSQGGHSTMAMHIMIEERYPTEFKVTASAPLSGPYDVSGVQAQVILQEKDYSNPGYLPYVIFSYNAAYHLFNKPSELLLPPYDTVLPPMFNGMYNMKDVSKQMPNAPAHIIRPEILETFRKDTANIYMAAMRKNDVYRWVPTAPVRMCYCEADEQVNYHNSLVAYDYFKAHGATNVQARSMGKHFGHGKCALYALATTKMWFDSFKHGSVKGNEGPAGRRMILAISKPIVRYRKNKNGRKPGSHNDHAPKQATTAQAK